MSSDGFDSSFATLPALNHAGLQPDIPDDKLSSASGAPRSSEVLHGDSDKKDNGDTNHQYQCRAGTHEFIHGVLPHGK